MPKSRKANKRKSHFNKRKKSHAIAYHIADSQTSYNAVAITAKPVVTIIVVITYVANVVKTGMGVQNVVGDWRIACRVCAKIR